MKLLLYSQWLLCLRKGVNHQGTLCKYLRGHIFCVLKECYIYTLNYGVCTLSLVSLRPSMLPVLMLISVLFSHSTFRHHRSHIALLVHGMRWGTFESRLSSTNDVQSHFILICFLDGATGAFCNVMPTKQCEGTLAAQTQGLGWSGTRASLSTTSKPCVRAASPRCDVGRWTKDSLVLTDLANLPPHFNKANFNM